MKNFCIKYLITFHATRKNWHFMLAMLVIATIITHIRGNMTASRICLVLCVCLMTYMLALSIVCTMHREKHQRFKVYLSFSERRIPQMAQYISDYLKHAFWVFNIDYYDFREHERFHYLDEPDICNEIDKNLADSDIFLRFIGHGLEPNKVRLIINRFNHIQLNPFTGGLSFEDGFYTYYDYEVNASFDKFGLNNRNNRFQIMPLEIMAAPMKHIQTIYIDSEEPALNYTLRLINILSRGYQEQQYWERSALFWRMRDQMTDHLGGE